MVSSLIIIITKCLSHTCIHHICGICMTLLDIIRHMCVCVMYAHRVKAAAPVSHLNRISLSQLYRMIYVNACSAYVDSRNLDHSIIMSFKNLYFYVAVCRTRMESKIGTLIDFIHQFLWWYRIYLSISRHTFYFLFNWLGCNDK